MAERNDTSGEQPRRAIRRLNRDLDRVGRGKRSHLLRAALLWLFAGAVILPVGWVALYGVLEAPGTVLMAQRAFEGEKVRRRPAPLESISVHLVRAVIAAEDSGFCSHDGFEVEAIQAALEQNQKGGRLRGGSTISQQTAKNLFLWPERSWLRKGLEAYFTVLIEAFWSKDRIMEAYLNAAEWGDGLFGAEAAAQARFGVSAKDLSPLQAARLAAVLPSPNKWSADAPGPYVRKRTGQIQARARAVRAQGLADCVTGAAEGARPAEPPRSKPSPAPRDPGSVVPLPPLDEAPPDALLSEIERALQEGPGEPAGEPPEPQVVESVEESAANPPAGEAAPSP